MIMSTRAAAAAVALIASQMLFSFSASAQTRYSLTEIGFPDVQRTALGGINNNGDITGTSDSRSFIYSHGTMTDITAQLGANANPQAINDEGQVMGMSLKNPSLVFIYTNGTAVDPGAPKGTGGALPDGFNNLGEITVQTIYLDPFNPGPPYFLAWVYRNGKYAVIPSFGGMFTRAYAVNNLGAVAGGSTFAGETKSHAFVYENGTMTDIGTIANNFSSAYDINDRGSVTGRSMASAIDPSIDHAFLYQKSTGRMIDLGSLGGTYSYGESINNSDVVVGASTLKPAESEQNAFVYFDSKMWDLNDLIDANDPNGAYVRLFAAHGINDHGWIIAGGLDSRFPGRIKGYLVRPIGN